jgi:hypothetical protein
MIIDHLDGRRRRTGCNVSGGMCRGNMGVRRNRPDDVMLTRSNHLGSCLMRGSNNISRGLVDRSLMRGSNHLGSCLMSGSNHLGSCLMSGSNHLGSCLMSGGDHLGRCLVDRSLVRGSNHLGSCLMRGSNHLGRGLMGRSSRGRSMLACNTRESGESVDTLGAMCTVVCRRSRIALVNVADVEFHSGDAVRRRRAVDHLSSGVLDDFPLSRLWQRNSARLDRDCAVFTGTHVQRCCAFGMRRDI